MTKKLLFAFLTLLVLGSPALAIEVPANAGVGFNPAATAYTPATFNAILEACGLHLSADALANVPSSYAKAVDGKVVFKNESMAYSPKLYHAILTAYGLQLNPAKVETMGIPDYATASDGKATVKNAPPSIAFTGDAWTRILAAYEKPVMTKPEPSKPEPMVSTDNDGDGVPNAKDRCPNTPKGVHVDENGCWAFTGVLFDFDKTAIKPQFKQALNETKKVFDLNPDLKVTVEGNTDSIGTKAYNQRLSVKRAKAVVNYLVHVVGIQADRLTAVGYGETRPIADNHTKAGRAKNRRVELTPETK